MPKRPWWKFWKRTALPPPPPPGPPPPPLPPPPPGPPPRNRYVVTWNREVPDYVTRGIMGETGYSAQEVIQAHLAIFLAFPGMDYEEPAVRYDLWADYCRVMVANRGDREEFFADMGIYSRDFDWEGWRIAMGYNRREAA